MTRLLLDANILTSYLLTRHPTSPITKIVEAGLRQEYTLLLPADLLQEFSHKITTKPYLAERISADEMERFGTALLTDSEVIPKITQTIPAVTRDPKDDYLLAYAVVGRADFLVTGDEDLLVLGRVQDVTICRPRELPERFLAA